MWWLIGTVVYLALGLAAIRLWRLTDRYDFEEQVQEDYIKAGFFMLMWPFLIPLGLIAALGKLGVGRRR